jgi:uncharacterized membrane protein SpoIIM required for sporulation
MTEQAFTGRREAAWREFASLALDKRRGLRANAPAFVRGFREIAQDLNIARAHGFDPALVERLNMLVNEGYQIIYSRRAFALQEPARFFLRTFPQSVRSHWRGIGAVMLLFYGLAVFAALLCVRFPPLAAELVSGSTLERIEEMYNPEGEHFLRPRDAASDADMFGYYIYNNISIAFRTFSGGILAGFGSLLLLCANAVYLGVAAGYIINLGYAGTFFPFIIAHSSFELTAIILSAYGGLLLGYRLIVTGGLSRGASLRKAGKDALPLIAGSAAMLVLAALVEAFWSSRHFMPMTLRLGAGAALWLVLLLYFLFAGKGSGHGPA